MTENEIMEFKKSLAGVKYGKEFLQSISMIPGLLDSMEENLKQIMKSTENLKEILKPFAPAIEIKRTGWETF